MIVRASRRAFVGRAWRTVLLAATAGLFVSTTAATPPNIVMILVGSPPMMLRYLSADPLLTLL